jgi:hypothetical protein
VSELGEWTDDEVPAGPPSRPDTCFDTVGDWVEGWLVPLWRRAPRRWCPQWWRHPEAAARLDAMWQAWEQLRLEPGVGPSVFLRDHLDPHMAVLTSDEGPFARCEEARHGGGRPRLPTVPVPAGLLDAQLAQAEAYRDVRE